MATESEQERLEQFSQDFSAEVAGYMNQVADDLTGIPRYIGEDITEEQLEESISKAENVLGFIEARNGQMAYSMEILSTRNNSKHVNMGGESLRPSQVIRDFRNRISQFNEYEEDVSINIETVTYSQDTSFCSVDLEEASKVPDFDINDWSWPRRNLWPFE